MPKATTRLFLKRYNGFYRLAVENFLQFFAANLDVIDEDAEDIVIEMLEAKDPC
jgi:hypothetical protein